MSEENKIEDPIVELMQDLIAAAEDGTMLTVAERLCEMGWRKQSEWISVEERLPDGNGRFLTVDEKGNMMTCYFGGRFGWFASVCDKNAITHWMPLPEQPKPER